jgi:hypothetical protein
MARSLRAAVVLAPVLLGFGGIAHAQYLYKCVASSGKTITSDRPPVQECPDKIIYIMRPDGTPAGKLDPPMTPEQRRKAAEEEKRRIEEQEAALDQKRKDRSLLETYGSADEIDATRKRAVADRQALIDRAQKRLDELKRDKKRLNDETEFYQKREMPEKLKRQLADNNDAIRGQERSINETKADIRRVEDFYGAQAKRFRELMELGATPVQRTAEGK